MSFNAKTVVITGGLGGIGFSLAREFLSEGAANVALLDVSDHSNRVDKLRDNFKQQNIITLKVDVASKPDVERVFKEIIDQFKSIDVLINAAGILDENQIEATIQTNLLGVINTTVVGLEHMSQHNGGNGGTIASISSVMGITTVPTIPVYVATKHAVVGFMRALGHDYILDRHGVKFITICPGLTETQIIAGFGEKIFFPDALEMTNHILQTLPVQSAATLAKLITELLPSAKNRSLWIIDDGKSEETEITKYWTI